MRREECIIVTPHEKSLIQHLQYKGTHVESDKALKTHVKSLINHVKSLIKHLQYKINKAAGYKIVYTAYGHTCVKEKLFRKRGEKKNNTRG